MSFIWCQARKNFVEDGQKTFRKQHNARTFYNGIEGARKIDSVCRRRLQSVGSTRRNTLYDVLPVTYDFVVELFLHNAQYSIFMHGQGL